MAVTSTEPGGLMVLWFMSGSKAKPAVVLV